MSTKISSVIIAKNEGQNIRQCIESQISVIDEIIVLIDDTSSDDTYAIASSFPSVRCELVKWQGFVKTKEAAISLASHTWILWVDADEALTEPLRQELLEWKDRTPENSVYRFPRKAYFLNQWVKHGGWYPGYVYRLFDKGHVHFAEKQIHEHLEWTGASGTFTSAFDHFTDPNLEHYYKKSNRYTSLASVEMAQKKRRTSITGAAVRSFMMFIKMYILKLGFLDGKIGFLLAVLSAQYVFSKYAKLWELNFIEENKDGK